MKKSKLGSYGIMITLTFCLALGGSLTWGLPSSLAVNDEFGATGIEEFTAPATQDFAADEREEPVTAAAEAIYVSPNGSSGNPGTIASPTTLAAAIAKVSPGGTIYLRGGTYNFSAPVTIERNNSGSAGQYKTIAPYGSEKPVLDFYAQAFASDQRGLQIFGHYWHVKGLEVRGAGG
ncbi:hypothetical protein HMSSN036_75480 [Paenibacillus macerans]|nr:hypothetical protein HMSSN036_75480 [Paenibacillus macerans]